MIKMTFCVRRKEGMSEEEFHDYWLNKHGPLVKSVAKDLNISRYVLPPIGEDIPPLAEAVAELKKALTEARSAEDHLRKILTEGEWLE